MKPILFTVSYAGLWGQDRLSLPECLNKAKELGYEGVEVMGKRPHLSVLDVGLEEARELRRLADELGLEVATIAAYTNFTGGLESPEVPFPELQLAYIKRLAELGAVLGAKIIRLFTGYFSERLPFFSQWNLCVDLVREAAQIASNYGLVVGVQNHHDIGVSVECYEDFLDDVGHPSCRAMFDAWSPALQGADLYYWARRIGGRAVQTTVADYVRYPRWRQVGHLSNYERLQPDAVRAVPMGEGFIDYRSFFRGLKEAGFDGYVAYEMCWPLRGGGKLANLDASARKSLAVIRELIG
jgi:sugar phosphate isomerase/epimerase